MKRKGGGANFERKQQRAHCRRKKEDTQNPPPGAEQRRILRVRLDEQKRMKNGEANGVANGEENWGRKGTVTEWEMNGGKTAMEKRRRTNI
jgi:hypothetical protein